MAGERNHWWPCKLKYLEANYERCKLKVRQDSLYCKLFILEYQTRLEEEKRITLKYEKNAICQRLQQAEQKHLDLTNEKELVVKKAVVDLTNVEGEWKAKTDKLIKEIEYLQEEKENEIKYKDDYILELTKELQDLRKLSQSKEPHAAGNGGEQSGNKRKLDKTKETQVLREQNCQKSTTSNSIEVQYPDDIVHEETKTIFESRKGNCDVGDSNLVLDNSEKSETSYGENLLESEVGSVLEVTEGMLKSCRRRSVLKRKKPEVCGLVLEDNDSDTVELTECTKQDKTRRERRVTFNGELEFKLPDGSKEVAELVIDDSSEQLESHDGQNGREDDLVVFDDILSRETHVGGEGLDTGCNALEEASEKMAEMKTWNLEGEDERNGHDNEVKNETESCDKNLAERKRKTDLRKKSKKKEGNKIVVQQGSVQKNQRVAVDTENNGENDKNSGDKEKDKIEKMKGDENRRISVEADILLSADRQSRDVQLNSGYGDTGETKYNTKTPKIEDKVQVESEKSNSDDAANAQLGETGGREGNYGPRRGLRQEASGTKNVKPSKRLLDVFGNEINGNEEPQSNESKEKAQRNRRGNKKKTSNAVARNKLVDIPISNKNLEKEDHAQNLEKQRDESLKDEAALENGDASDNENKPRKRKTQSKKASRKTTKTRKYAAKIENEVEGTSRKRRGKREREETTKEARESLLAIENEAEDESKNEEMEEHGRKGSKKQNCSPKQLSPLSGEVESSGVSKRGEVKDDAEEEQNIVDKKCGEEEVKDDVQQEQHMVDENYGKEEDGLLIEKKNAGRRRSLRKTQEKINEVDEPDIFDEIKERKPNLRSKKRKSPEPEIDEENNDDDGKQDLKENTENVNDCVEIDDKIGIAEEKEEHVNESERKQAKVNNVTENKKRKTNLRSKKRKSSELEIDKNHEQNNDNGIQDVNENNEDEKAEQVNGSESKETKVSILDEVKERKTTLRSKKRKSPEPEIDEIVDLNESKEAVRVEFENGETNESLRENIEEEISNKRQTGKNTKAAKRKSDTVVVNSAARKTKSRKGKKRETVDKDDQKSEGVALNVEDKDQEIRSVEGDDEDKEKNGKKANKRGRKRVLVAKEESEMNVMNKNEDHNEKMESVTGCVDDKDKESCGRKTKKKGRKRELPESEENDMKGKDDEGKGSEKGGSTRKTNEEEIEDKREPAGKMEKQEKPTKKKRRTLYSIRENTTFFNATSSIFQETLPFNQTRSSTGMPPTLSSFMKAFIVPKLKKK